MTDLPRCPISGKVSFRKRQAEEKRNKLERRGRAKRMRIYQCDCNFWHLTHMVDEPKRTERYKIRTFDKKRGAVVDFEGC